MKSRAPKAGGFDIIVWQKAKAAEVFCSAYTPAGREYLGKWFTLGHSIDAYEMGIIHPREFIGQAPQGLRIGGISPGSKVPMLINPHLH